MLCPRRSQNQYDARNFRTIRITPSLSETRHYYYSAGWQSVEERVGTSTTADRQFVWGARYIDDLVLRDVGSQRFYALQDANWNVTSIADTTGTVQERYAYTAYGNPTFLSGSFSVLSGSSYTWETLNCGYRYDSATELYSVRFRLYHPVLGMWLTRDALGYLGGASLYAAGFVPSGVDPFGLDDLNIVDSTLSILGSIIDAIMNRLETFGQTAQDRYNAFMKMLQGDEPNRIPGFVSPPQISPPPPRLPEEGVPDEPPTDTQREDLKRELPSGRWGKLEPPEFYIRDSGNNIGLQIWGPRRPPCDIGPFKVGRWNKLNYADEKRDQYFLFGFEALR